MKLQLITDLNELLASEQAWNGVAGARPFFRAEWALNWLRTGVDQVTPYVLVGTDDAGRWTGIAPFCIGKKTLQRKLRLLGSGPVCSDYLGLFTQPGCERKFTEAVADWVVANLPRNIDSLEFEGIDLSNDDTNYFCELLSASGFGTHSTELEGCWVLDLPNSWETLNASFSKSLRRKTKKAVQRLSDPQTEIRSSDDYSVDELWPIFVELHQQRRQMLGQAGCFANSVFESFLKTATQRLVAVSRAELMVIYHAGQPFACSLFVNDGVTNMMYQSGMKPETLALEPGYQIAVLGMQRSIDKGLQRFDFLRGDEPYKSRWLTTRVPLYRQKFIPRNFSSTLKHEIWKTGYSLKQWYKPSAPLSVGDE